ncbi:MAG: 6-bladed beta-propeller [Candidatus Aminicenantes bacterium]
MKKTIIYLIILMLFLAASCTQQDSEWKGNIKIQDGVTIVENPMEPMYSGDVLELEEDLVIGEKEGPEEYMFSEVRDIDVDSEENIYVLDSKETHIQVFDKDGAYLRTIGQKGQGPGEMQSARSISITPKNEILISDWSGRALHFFSLEGIFLKSLNLKGMLWFLKPVADSQNHIVAGYTVMDQTVTGYLKIFNPDLTEKKTIYSYQIAQYPKVNPFFAQCFWQIDSHDHIIWGYNDIYEIQYLKPDGSLFMKIIKEYDPVRITEQEKIEYYKSHYGQEEPPEGMELIWDSHHNPFIYLSIDEEGRVFVRTYEKDPNGLYYYDVFNSQGKYMAKIPLEHRPRVWKKDKLYVVSEDQQGFHQVRRYSVSWNLNESIL